MIHIFSITPQPGYTKKAASDLKSHHTFCILLESQTCAIGLAKKAVRPEDQDKQDD
jgi:hypothetical protein